MATKYLIFIGLIMLTSCSRPALMTYSDYDKIQSGSSIADLKGEIGSPYAIHHKEGGVVEYEYIERIKSGNNYIAENRYYIIVEDGKVTGKYMKQEKPPAYDLIYQEEPNYQRFP